ncbi:MAG: DUF4097 family beta strand repeat-containing protein, partial [Planctomycetota bacterium]
SALIWLKGDSSTNYVAGDITGNGVKFSASAVDVELDGAGDQTIDAGTGQLIATGTITKTGAGDLALHSSSGGLAIDLAEAVTAVPGNLWISADSGDIQLGGDLSSNAGGVSVISENGKIYTDGFGDMLNVAVTGTSDHLAGTGVDLPKDYDYSHGYETGKAAIVIMSRDTLKLGPNARLRANGTYYAGGTVDDRPGVDFLNVIEGDKNPGDPIDVAIYLASNAGNVSVASPVDPIAGGGAVVVDAYDTVEPFGTAFVNSLAGIGRLAVCSRLTATLNDAQTSGTLPYADDLGLFPGQGEYVLRGELPDTGTGAWVLEVVEETEEEGRPDIPIEDVVEASSVEAPPSPELGDIGEIQGAAFDNMQWLAQELGLCEGDERGEDTGRCQEITQAYLAGAFLQATDMRPHRAAVQLRSLVQILHDEGGTRIAALSRVVGEFVQSEGPPSDEQMDAIATAFAAHSNDGTHYATAGQWLDALAEYIAILTNEIGWSADDSVAFVMGKYATTLTETGDVATTAFIQMHLEALGG